MGLAWGDSGAQGTDEESLRPPLRTSGTTVKDPLFCAPVLRPLTPKSLQTPLKSNTSSLEQIPLGWRPAPYATGRLVDQGNALFHTQQNAPRAPQSMGIPQTHSPIPGKSVPGWSHAGGWPKACGRQHAQRVGTLALLAVYFGAWGADGQMLRSWTGNK